MTGVEIGLLVGGIICGLLLVAVVLVVFYIKRRNKRAEIKPDDVATMVEYIKTQKEQSDAVARAKTEKKELLKQQLETFKQTKENLKDKLKAQIDAKEWKPLESILKSADKGGVGIYVLHNATKNRYYVGQAKQIIKRIKDHFAVEEIARDFMAGDKIQVKYLTANELDAEYRLDHIEKTGIEIFGADYNKTVGNI